MMEKQFFLIPSILLLILLIGTSGTVRGHEFSPEEFQKKYLKKTGWLANGEPRLLSGKDLLGFEEDAMEYMLEYQIDWGFRARYLAGKDSVIVVLSVLWAPNQIMAFGFYAVDKSPSLKFYKLGFEAYQSGNFILCWYGQYIIKAESSDSLKISEKYLKQAVRTAQKLLPKQKRRTPILDALPEKNRVKHSEKFYLRRWLDQPYFRNIYYADYYTPQGYSRIFIIDNGTTAAADSNFWKYYAFLEKRQRILEEELRIDTDYFVVDEPLWGRTILAKKNQIIYGILDYRDMNWTEDRMKDVLEAVKKKKSVKAG